MTLNRQLPIAFAAITAAMFAAALFGISHVNRTNSPHISELRHSEDSLALHQDIALHFRWQVQEWKNFLLRGADPTDFNQYWRSFEIHERQARVKVQELIGRLQGDTSSVAAARRFDTAHRELGAAYRKAREEFVDNGLAPTAGDKAVRGIDREPSVQLEALATSLEQTFDAISENARETQAQAVRISLGGMLLMMVLGIVVGCVISRRITRNIGAESHVARAMVSQFGQGQLDTPIDVRNGDNASLVSQLAQLQHSLSDVVSRVRNNAQSIAGTSAQISRGNSELDQRTRGSTTALSDSSSEMNGLRDTLQYSSRQVQQAAGYSQTAITAARNGSDVVDNVITTMSTINDSSQKIAEITSVIDAIATQTNLLALNASVEAARAGAHGKGFAVVADEVGNLAKNAGAASRQISELAAESVARVDSGMALVSTASGTMQELLTSIQQVIDIIQGINSNAEQQMQSLDRVDGAITHMEEAMQQNAALVQDCADAAQSLESQADGLVHTVSAFSVR